MRTLHTKSQKHCEQPFFFMNNKPKGPWWPFGTEPSTESPKVYGATHSFPDELQKEIKPKINAWKRGQTVRDPIFEASLTQDKVTSPDDLLFGGDMLVTDNFIPGAPQTVANLPSSALTDNSILQSVSEHNLLDMSYSQKPSQEIPMGQAIAAPEAKPFPAAAYLSAFANSSHTTKHTSPQQEMGELGALQEHDWQMDQSRPPPVESKSSHLSKLQDIFTESEKVAYVTLVHLLTLPDLEGRYNSEVFSPPARVTYQSFLAKKQNSTLSRRQQEVRKDFGKGDLEIIFKVKTQAHDALLEWRKELLKKLVLYLDLGKEEEEMIGKMGVKGTGFESGGVDVLAEAVAMSLTPNDQKITETDARITLLNHLFLLNIVDGSGYPTFARTLLKRLIQVMKMDFSLTKDVEWRICEQLRLLEALTEAEEEADGVEMTEERPLSRQASSSSDPGKGTLVISTEATDLIKKREKKERNARLALMGLAAVGGGVALGLTAGLVAPLIGAGISATLGLVGVSGTATFLGSTAGVAVISGASAGMGVGLGGWKMHKRTRALATFRFVPVVPNELMSGMDKDAAKAMEALMDYEPKRFPTVTICISGWLTEGDEDFNSPWSGVDFEASNIAGGEAYALWWEPETLSALGSAFTMIAGEVISFGVQQILGATVLHALMMGLTLPMWMAKLGYALDNPWGNGLTKAKMAGQILADALQGQAQHNRPVTLVGYSLGARVIFYALLELSQRGLVGLVEDVIMVGNPVMATPTEWEQIATVCSGRVVNAYLPKDWVLGLLYRASTVGFTGVAGLGPVEGVLGIENVDLTGVVDGHLAYRTRMGHVLRKCGVLVADSDEPEVDMPQQEGEKDSGKIWNWDDIMELKRIQGQLEDYWEPKDLGASTLPALVLDSSLNASLSNSLSKPASIEEMQAVDDAAREFAGMRLEMDNLPMDQRLSVGSLESNQSRESFGE